MQLEKIKLSGFKSFVDQTVIPFSSNLSGIVGPNGCGKSNVIDAVKWVMGESSAKHLRGELLSDVIFNGTVNRKPVGVASVELVFDNSDCRIGGEFAKFTQLSIKRQVDRDGNSHYYLNGTRCRRKDITHIFLGTGLGPRSYSIIEQGMISKIIESKPEDLREYLEEVSGISKYKERRHETELKINHSKENILRINDIVVEIDKQLQHLKKQSAIAKRYKSLREEERKLRAELLAIKQLSLISDSNKCEAIIKNEETVLEGLNSNILHIKSNIEHQSQEYDNLNNNFQKTQSNYYTSSQKVNSLEQAISFHNEKKKQLQDTIKQQEILLKTTNNNIEQTRLLFSNIGLEINELHENINKEHELLAASENKLELIEQSAEKWQMQLDEITKLQTKCSQYKHIDQTKLENLKKQQEQLAQSINRLEDSLKKIPDISNTQSEIFNLKSNLDQLQLDINNKSNDLANSQQNIISQKEIIKTIESEINKLNHSIQILHGKLSSLNTLQNVALGEKNTGLIDWLDKLSIPHKTRLGREMEVADGWELAAELVFGNYLEAICIQDFKTHAKLLTSLEKGDVILFHETDEKCNNSHTNKLGCEKLSDKIKTKLPIESIIGNIYTADSINNALEITQNLNKNESIVTKDGYWLSKYWIRAYKSKSEKSGLFERERLIKLTENDISKEQLELSSKQSALEKSRSNLSIFETQKDLISSEINQLKVQVNTTSMQITLKKSEFDQAEKQKGWIGTEIKTFKETIEKNKSEINSHEISLISIIESYDQYEIKKATVLATKESIIKDLSKTRGLVQQQQKHAHEFELLLREKSSKKISYEHIISQTSQQLEYLENKQKETLLEIEKETKELLNLQNELQNMITQYISFEQTLNEQKQHLDKFQNDIKNNQTNAKEIEKQISAKENCLSEKKLELNTLQVKLNNVQEQLEQMHYSIDSIDKGTNNIPNDFSEDAWNNKIKSTEDRIQKLGPVNLASLEEYETTLQRKTYLDMQVADLNNALATLEDAIKKIDKETKEKFKETFDQVNDKFQKLFPRLFGGGRGYLMLSEDNLLNAGIYVMAKPPGKNINSIHLLSGGEKALTAVSLIFALFQLNPSPFCMLDEVDAPLDDLNVHRFCELLQEMAQTVQFIFISHNKNALKSANHLIGVTMNEPGVSRIVSVDIDEAIALAGS